MNNRYFVIVAHGQGRLPEFVEESDGIPKIFDSYIDAEKCCDYAKELVSPDKLQWAYTIVQLED